MSYSGVLNINKPPGITSRAVVDRVDQLVHPERSGHAGTLDPLATGVLVVCVGSATRLIAYVQRMRKSYRAEFRFGLRSDTDDIEGNVQSVDVPEPPDRASLERVLRQFEGPIDQVPPAYSAVKVQGRRAYKLARENKSFELEPRRVTIHRLQLLDYQFPVMQLAMECSSGTYVRALGRDVAAVCGTSVVMSALERTAVGPFRVENAWTLTDLSAETLATALQPATAAVSDLATLPVQADQVRRLLNGLPIEVPGVEGPGEYAAVDDAGQLVAIVAATASGQLRPVKCFPR